MRNRFLQALLAFLCVLGLAVRIHGQDLGGASLKENLDLPVDIIGGGVNFYGQGHEGDGFFFAVSRSGSMQDRGELHCAKVEISRSISEFLPKTQFAVVFFDAAIKKFPANGRPADANPSMKEAALSWIANMRGGSGSCIMEGLREALQYANLATAKRKVIVYYGDGGGTCHGSNERTYLQTMVTTITAQNYQRARIDVIAVLMGGQRQLQESFLKALTAANGGTYREIN